MPSGAAELPLVLVKAVQHAVLVPGDICKRAVTAAQVELDRPGAFGEAGCILGFMEHPTIGEHQDDPLLPVRHRIAYRLAVRPHYTGNFDPRPPSRGPSRTRSWRTTGP